MAPSPHHRLCAGFLSEIADRAFNHNHVGVTALHPPLHAKPSPSAVPKGFRVNARQQFLGNGMQVGGRKGVLWITEIVDRVHRKLYLTTGRPCRAVHE